MATTLEKMAAEALALPPEDPAELADILVLSLDTAELTDLDIEWVAEAKRRRDEVRTGSIKTIPGKARIP